ncbi:MAG: SDR family oxidoreductase [Armatimonadota bacterium]|nr:SDR family oxidoreductase [Armatimonadota bacterium]
MQLQDQVAIITGASSGIGAAVARDLHAAGMKLVITARREERLLRLAGEHDDILCVAGDIADPELPANLVATAVDAFGRCDVVFNNAGILEVASLDKIDIERVCAMVRINVEAAFRMAYVAVQHFRSAGRGHLINTSSVLGTKVRPTAGWYAGTKFAIEALSEALRMELVGTNIKISCIEPGLVLTELHDNWEVHPTQQLNVSQPLQPEEIARCIRFLLEQPEHVRIPRLMILPGEQQI